MAFEKTFSMIKPDATSRRLVGSIIQRFEQRGLSVGILMVTTLSREEAEYLYWEHHEREHFSALVDYTISGPVVLMRLEGENAIRLTREIMGASNPEKAEAGTIRKDFAESNRRNSIHGSDGEDAATRELAYFFGSLGVA